MFYKIVDEADGTISITETTDSSPNDFGTYAVPVNGSKPLFLFEDEEGNEFLSIDPYSLSEFPYDGATIFKGILGFVLPSEIVNATGSYVELNALFPSGDYYLDSNPSETIYALRGNSVPEPSMGFLMTFAASGIFLRRTRSPS